MKSDSNSNIDNGLLPNDPSLNQDSNNLIQFIVPPRASTTLAIEQIPLWSLQQSLLSGIPLASLPVYSAQENNNSVSLTDQNQLQQQQQLMLLLQQQQIPEPDPIAEQPQQETQLQQPGLNPEVENQPQQQQSQQHQQQLPNPTMPRRRLISERDKFLLFIKVLLKYLARADETQRLRQRAKLIVAECTRRNRMGDLDYSPLKQAVERRLQGALGMEQWNRTQVIFDFYCQRNGFEVSNASRLASV